MWNIQLAAHLKRQWMEDNIENLLWAFWICCDAIWPYKCAFYFSTSNEQCLSWIFGQFCGLLHQWHPHFLKKNGGPWAPCMFGFGKALRGWAICQIGKVWILSIWSGILGLHYLKRWHLHRSLQGSNHCWLGYSSLCSRCLMLS
jgi:hypothetical protein